MLNDMAVEKLQVYKKYADDILQNLELVDRNPPPAEGSIPASVARIHQEAQKTKDRASSFIKVGVMGEFSAGKTLLLGSLIGFADALPINENPTTGNVTALCLIQQEGLHTTQLDEFQVHYLSQNEAKDCLRYMLDEVLNRARNARLSQPQIDALSAMNVADQHVWEAIINWCEDAWSNKNLELRYLLRELINFSHTYLAYGSAACEKSVIVNKTIAREGLQFPQIEADKTKGIQDLSFDQIVPILSPWKVFPETFSTEDLQNTFSLVRRIDVTVKVSNKFWDLSGLQGANQLIILDFPGLGAPGSGVRDRYLSLKELQEVQTILILLNGISPASDRADSIFTMLQQERPDEDLKDRILIGVGRFDQLALNDGGEQILDKLTQTEQLEETTVLDQLRILQTAITRAKSFPTDHNKIVFLSPMLSLADQAKNSSHNVKVGSQEFLTRLDYPGYLDQATRLRPKWRQLSQHLLKSNSRSSLGKQLRDFAEDGGIGQLQKIIQAHVVKHGLNQLLTDTETAVTALKQEKLKLTQELENLQQEDISIIDHPTLLQLTNAIQGLLEKYNRFKEELETQPIRNRQDIPVTEVIREKLKTNIYNWSEWTLLFNKIKNGIVVLTAQGSGSAKILFDEDDLVDNTTPTTSDDFYRVFAKTLQQLHRDANQAVYDAVVARIDKLSVNISDNYHQLKAFLLPELKQSIQQQFGREGVRLFQGLLRAHKPEDWQQTILEQSNLITDIEESKLLADDVLSESPDFKLFFPLACKDERHIIGQVFDWGAKKHPTQPKPTNHQFLILRIREEFIDSASLHILQKISEMEKKVNGEFLGIVDQINPRLQDLSRNDSLLRFIASGEQGLNPDKPSWLRALEQVVSVVDPDSL
ncbi:MAG: dynamin family protein [Nostoc sp. DedSLP03]|uniref:dynamin family protein n=1 Tax=Nostoc sp. DedSLP03 TaxID=3075400 RepID=UPI002AD1E43A|nr:dynamin family protein [Nostoc sp. DedSLP03]MDZ7966421.1 dynamin family protein [Nostoc sp. DedSLP03]